MTKLEQLQKSGLRRVGTQARGYKYKSAGGIKVSAADLKRIDELKIPPAWSDAWINAAAGGAVQAIGRDAAGRLRSLSCESRQAARGEEVQAADQVCRSAAENARDCRFSYQTAGPGKRAGDGRDAEDSFHLFPSPRKRGLCW